MLLFWTIFASYGWQQLKSKLLKSWDSQEAWNRIHLRNARRLVQGFMRLRGVFIKMGQVLSVLGGFLPKAFGQELEQLQDRVPPHKFREVEPRLRAGLGDDYMKHFDSFDHEPIAAASLAQVHHAIDKDGNELAVKLLYPGVDALIKRDMRVLRYAAKHANKMFGLIHLPTVLEQLNDMLSRETNYANERANMERMRKLFEGRDDVVVPEVVEELSADGLLTMSYEPGCKITDMDALAREAIDVEQVAQLLVECYFAMLWTERVFHADPHPGNFLVRPGPTLIILDYGAVEDVSDTLADGMKMVVLGAMMKSDDQILMGLEHMGFVAHDGDRELLATVGRKYLKALGDVKIDDFSRMDGDTVRKLSGFDQTRGKIRELMKHVRYPEGFFYVERTLILLFGLVGRLSPKTGLPGLVGPYAMKAFAADMMGGMGG